MNHVGIVLITGANRGIGCGLAKHFARRGWRVIATCRRPAEAGELQALAARSEGRMEILPLEVRDDVSIAAMASAVATSTRSLDMLVNNAGILPRDGAEKIGTLSIGAVLDAFDVNVAGAIRTTQALLPLLRAGSRPRIVNISSGGGSLKSAAIGLHPSYCISKAALNMFTRRAALDLKPLGITVVSVSPGFVQTDMTGPHALLPLDEATELLAKTFEELQPEHTGQWLDRFGKPSEYAW